jgi:hypothetical protein
LVARRETSKFLGYRLRAEGGHITMRRICRVGGLLPGEAQAASEEGSSLLLLAMTSRRAVIALLESLEENPFSDSAPRLAMV